MLQIALMNHLNILIYFFAIVPTISAITTLFQYKKTYKKKFLLYFIFYFSIFLLSIILNLISKYYLANIIDLQQSTKLDILIIVFMLYSMIYLIFIWEIYLILSGCLYLSGKQKIYNFLKYFILLTISSLVLIIIGFVIFIEGHDTDFYRIVIFLGSFIALFLFFFLFWKLWQSQLFSNNANKIISFTFISFSIIFSLKFLFNSLALKGGFDFPFKVIPSIYLVQSLISIYIIKFLLEPYLKKNIIHNSEPERIKEFLDFLGLSKRESEVAGLILEGQTNKEIEEKLFISISTVKFHVGNIYKKSSVQSRNQFINLSRNT